MVTQLSPKDWESLSAYLDGQLTGRELKELETRLLIQPGLAAELEALRHTQKVLWHLPRHRVPRNFTLTADMVGIRTQPRFFPVARLASLMAGLLLVLSFVGEWMFAGRAYNSTALVVDTPAVEERVALQDEAAAIQATALPTSTLSYIAVTEAPAAMVMPTMTEPVVLPMALPPPAMGGGGPTGGVEPGVIEAPVVVEAESMPEPAPKREEEVSTLAATEESTVADEEAGQRAASYDGMSESPVETEPPCVTETSSPLATEESFGVEMFVVPGIAGAIPETESAESVEETTPLPMATMVETPQTISETQVIYTPVATQTGTVDNAQRLLVPAASPTLEGPESTPVATLETPLSATEQLEMEKYSGAGFAPAETALPTEADNAVYLESTPTMVPTVPMATNTLAAKKVTKVEPTSTDTKWIVITNPTEEPPSAPVIEHFQVATATMSFTATQEQATAVAIIAGPTASPLGASTATLTGALLPVQPPVAGRPLGETILEWIRPFRVILLVIMLGAGVLAVYWWRRW